MILFDTHVLYWWIVDAQRLSPLAQDWCQLMDAPQKKIYLSSVTLWELEYKRRAGRLPFVQSFRHTWHHLKRLSGVELITPTEDDWLLAAELDWTHRDPADRMLAAIAKNRSIPILTKDEKFHTPDCPVQALW